MATPATTIFGAPISGYILDRIHWLGMSSWRWLLILEGAPAIVLGLLTYFLLPSRPEEARFLTADEKGWISEELAREEQQKVGHGTDSILQGLVSGRVWHLVFVYLGMMFGLHILSSWAPQLVKALSALYSNSVIGLLLIMPNVIGLVAIILVSRSSDRMLERRYHVAIAAVVAGTALLLLGTAPSPVLSMALLCLLVVGVYSYLGPFWALPNEFLTGYSSSRHRFSQLRRQPWRISGTGYGRLLCPPHREAVCGPGDCGGPCVCLSNFGVIAADENSSADKD